MYSKFVGLELCPLHFHLHSHTTGDLLIYMTFMPIGIYYISLNRFWDLFRHFSFLMELLLENNEGVVKVFQYNIS